MECENDSLSEAQEKYQEKFNKDIEALASALKANGFFDIDGQASDNYGVANGKTSSWPAKRTYQKTKQTTTTVSPVPRPKRNRVARVAPEVEDLTKSSSKTNSNAQSPATTGRGGGSNVPLTPLPSSASRIRNLYLMNIIVRPRNFLAPSIALQQRKVLDLKVKAVLIKTAQDFVEWLLTEGMIRTQQYCSTHRSHPTNQPLKLKLGIFSDPKVLSTSGGYVWISECCGRKYVSVYSGSIFHSTPIDKVPPQSVLKLIYHWSCQTSIPNVESWVKVEKVFINKMYNYLRCVCTVMLQDKVYDFGFDFTAVELGIVSLGTSTADGAKKSVKVEILGLYDRKMKSYRLFASSPEPNNTSRQRFMRILKPIENVIHKNATVICDQSIDRNCLHALNYSRVSVCESSEDEHNPQNNATIMYYLRKHVPKLFQSALSQLSLEQVQLVLDELCWREKFGTSAANCYQNILEHIIYLTSRETENPGLLHLLDYVSINPHKNWRYKSVHVPKGPLAIQPSVINNNTAGGPPEINLQTSTSKIVIAPIKQIEVVKPKLTKLAPKQDPKPAVITIPTTQDVKPQVQVPKLPVVPIVPVVAQQPAPPQSLTALQHVDSYFYGTIPGDDTLGQETNHCDFKCHQCNTTYKTNEEFYTHMKWHLSGKMNNNLKYMCRYCVFPTNSEKELEDHMNEHLMLKKSQAFTLKVDAHLWCRICSESFESEGDLLVHMTRKHVEAELPYRCEVCQFATSIYIDLLDHFHDKHKGTPYVLCHLCLNVKNYTPQGVATFSSRLMTHLLKHSVKNKCKSCLLTFYSKYMLQEHKNKDHISCCKASKFKKYEIPSDREGKVVSFRPPNKQVFPFSKIGEVKDDSFFLKPTISMSSVLADQSNMKIGVTEKRYNCIECEDRLECEGHFKKYLRCTRCCYSTSCHMMITRHSQVFHPNGNKKCRTLPYVLGPPIRLSSKLFCICGFSSMSGNHLSRHLALCEGGRKSAYPTYANAMGITGKPSLDEYLKAARAISEGSREEGGSPPPQDITPYMTMNMEVDEPNSPIPALPLDVEIEEG